MHDNETTGLSPAESELFQFFLSRISAYQQDIALFAEEVLRFAPDEWQRSVFTDVVAAPRVTVKSGQGVGKTGCEAIVLLWFLCCFPFPRVVATAPTRQQLHDVLWSEVAKWQTNSPLLSKILRWTKTYIYMQGYEKRWFAVARTATKPENMQGFHEDNMLFIVDEASGVADPILEAIRGTLSGSNNKLLLCGNPTRTTGLFFDCFNSDRADYRCHTVNSEHSPRTNKENIASLIRKYGRDSNVVRVRVLGEFPLQEDDVFIHLSDVEASVSSEIRTFSVDDFGRDIVTAPILSIDIGCDVARFGNDNTCIAYKINEVCKIHKKYKGQDTMWTANNVAKLGLELVSKYHFKDKIPVKVDDGGVGGGVVDKLRELKRNNPSLYGWLEVIPVNFGTRIQHKYYHDSTTYMMSIVRDLISSVDDNGKPKPVELILPNDNDLIAQLSTRKYAFNANGKQIVESKENYKERNGGTSPDEADCIMLVCLPVNMKKEKKGAR